MLSDDTHFTLRSAVWAAVVVVSIAVTASCDTRQRNAATDQVRSNNDALVKMVAAGADPIVAQCAINRDQSAACVARQNLVVVSSTRSDELPQPQAQLTPFERQLLGK